MRQAAVYRLAGAPSVTTHWLIIAAFAALSPLKKRYMLPLDRVTITSGLEALPALTAFITSL